jgi:hypothetical protein
MARLLEWVRIRVVYALLMLEFPTAPPDADGVIPILGFWMA